MCVCVSKYLLYVCICICLCAHKCVYIICGEGLCVPWFENVEIIEQLRSLGLRGKPQHPPSHDSSPFCFFYNSHIIRLASNFHIAEADLNSLSPCAFFPSHPRTAGSIKPGCLVFWDCSPGWPWPLFKSDCSWGLCSSYSEPSFLPPPPPSLFLFWKLSRFIRI